MDRGVWSGRINRVTGTMSRRGQASGSSHLTVTVQSSVSFKNDVIREWVRVMAVRSAQAWLACDGWNDDGTVRSRLLGLFDQQAWARSGVKASGPGASR